MLFGDRDGHDGAEKYHVLCFSFAQPPASDPHMDRLGGQMIILGGVEDDLIHIEAETERETSAELKMGLFVRLPLRGTSPACLVLI